MEYAKRLPLLQMIVSSPFLPVRTRKATLLPRLSLRWSTRTSSTHPLLGPRSLMMHHNQGCRAIVTGHHGHSSSSHRSIVPQTHCTLVVDQTNMHNSPDIINKDRQRSTGSAPLHSGGSSSSRRHMSGATRICAPNKLHTNARYSMSTLPSAEESFRIIRIAVDTGDSELVCCTQSEILARTRLLPRDLVGLALSGRRERRDRAAGNAMSEKMRQPPTILPRNDSMILSFGPIRAVAERDFVYIFDVDNQVAKSFAEEVSLLYKERAASIEQQERQQEQDQNLPSQRNGTTPHDCYKQIPTAHEEHPELVFLEAVLADAVESFSRRIRIFEPVVDDLLMRVSTDEEFSAPGIHQLAPLKDQLQSLEVFVTQAYQCLTQLLNDDEEMLKLLLTEQAEARRTNIPVAFERHQHVELLLGVYSRQFSTIMQEVNYLLSRIECKQEFLDLELALYRNRLIRMNVDLGILTAATGVTTAVSGTFGMNLITGLENSSSAFMIVSAASAMGALGVASFFRSRLFGKKMQTRGEQRIEEIQTLSRVLSDMTALDHTVKKMIKGKRRMNRDEFKKELNLARHAQACSDKEIDLLFKILDTQKDDALDGDDFADHDDFSDKEDSPVVPTPRDANGSKHP